MVANQPAQSHQDVTEQPGQGADQGSPPEPAQRRTVPTSVVLNEAHRRLIAAFLAAVCVDEGYSVAMSRTAARIKRRRNLKSGTDGERP